MSRAEPKTYTLDGFTGTVRELVDHFQSKATVKVVHVRLASGWSIADAIRRAPGFNPGNRKKTNKSASKPDHGWQKPLKPELNTEWRPKP